MTLNSFLGAAALLLVVSLSADAAPRKLSDKEHTLLQKLVLAEAGNEGKLGMALVARSVLNRTALVATRKVPRYAYMARGRTIAHIVRAPKQYEPVATGTINKRRSKAKMAQAAAAIRLGMDTAKLNQALAAVTIGRRAAKLGPEARKHLMHATGFRTKGAYKDSSQYHNRETYRNHVFNSDKFAKKIDVVAVYANYWGGGAGGFFNGAGSGSLVAGLQRGDRGSAVSALQSALNKRGADVAVDGIFGPATQAALKAFQKKNQLAQSGQVDPRTRDSLTALRPEAVGAARGAQGYDVRMLQRALNQRGAKLKVDGVFGPATEKALKTFQSQSQLTPNGKLDPQTRRAFTQPVFALPIGTKRGATGRHVRTLQAELNRRGAKLKVDGVFGAQTQIALRTFQEAYGLEVNGTIDQPTFRALLKR